MGVCRPTAAGGRWEPGWGSFSFPPLVGKKQADETKDTGSCREKQGEAGQGSLPSPWPPLTLYLTPMSIRDSGQGSEEGKEEREGTWEEGMRGKGGEQGEKLRK